ncbi:type IV pilus modification PilV family protein [Hyalangium minutum]|uniref:Prepilin-type N-terminal cleavage/methylation domain-containing protein n=1 Tax=Hyalangium minutum TaxID=394096 RepID=A0A085WMC7_9BACT|nr:hypothetical protein [Hyalangium minutum]KFE68840.1 hypothetical protein DB31_6742 [Hyalangium minutum]
MRSSRSFHRGSSLIEAMAALAVFTIGIIGIMDMNLLASKQNTLARSRTVASKIARDVADSFERIPFKHPMLSVPTGLLMTDDEFDNIENEDGLVKLETAVAQTTDRPILGAADAMFTSEGDRTFYKVAWRVIPVANPQRAGQVDQKRILIMVRFPSPGGGMVDVKTWAVRYDVELITGDDQTLLEL